MLVVVVFFMQNFCAAKTLLILGWRVLMQHEEYLKEPISHLHPRQVGSIRIWIQVSKSLHFIIWRKETCFSPGPYSLLDVCTTWVERGGLGHHIRHRMMLIELFRAVRNSLKDIQVDFDRITSESQTVCIIATELLLQYDNNNILLLRHWQ